jgi:hypothetical protein
MRTMLSSCVLAIALSLEVSAQAHIQLTSPAARYRQDNSGLKTAPCGSGTATGTVTDLTPGQMLTVSWKESIAHAGHYRIALASSESTFVEPTSLEIPTTLPDWVLADGITDKTGTSTYSYEVKLPDRECPSCVLQLLQVMSTGTDGTNTGPFSGVYHACADLHIAAGDTDASAASDSASPDLGRLDLATQRREVAEGAGGAGGKGSTLNDAGSAAGGRSGTGGAAASGGAAGSGGILSNGSEAGGAPGGGGAASGGDKGGRPEAEGGAGGSSSQGETAAGGAGGTSSTTAASGGSSANAGAGTSDGGTQGCSCHVEAPAETGRWARFAVVAGMLALRSRRRRR